MNISARLEELERAAVPRRDLGRIACARALYRQLLRRGLTQDEAVSITFEMFWTVPEGLLKVRAFGELLDIESQPDTGDLSQCVLNRAKDYFVFKRLCRWIPDAAVQTGEPESKAARVFLDLPLAKDLSRDLVKMIVAAFDCGPRPGFDIGQPCPEP